MAFSAYTHLFYLPILALGVFCETPECQSSQSYSGDMSTIWILPVGDTIITTTPPPPSYQCLRRGLGKDTPKAAWGPGHAKQLLSQCLCNQCGSNPSLIWQMTSIQG